MKTASFLSVLGLASALVLSASAQGLTEDVAFDIENNTGATITGLYLTTSDDPSWGEDIAVDYIAPGEVMEVSITDDLPDCLYDLAITFSDGDELAYGEVDVCALDGETLTVE